MKCSPRHFKVSKIFPGEHAPDSPTSLYINFQKAPPHEKSWLRACYLYKCLQKGNNSNIVILKSVRVTRNSKRNSGLLLKLVKSETVTFQTSYYVRVNSRGAHLPLATPMLEFGPGHEFGLGPLILNSARH